MPKYLTGGQLAECQRSGQKCLASQLVRDGRNPQLLVLPEWADEAHPQERPYLPNDTEGRARFPIAPEQLPHTGPVLSAERLGDALVVSLSWTEVDTVGPRIDTYTLFRSAGGAFSEVAAFEVDFGNGIDDTPTVTTEYTDEDLAFGVTYRYRVVATSGTDPYDAEFISNTEEIEIPAAAELPILDLEFNGVTIADYFDPQPTNLIDGTEAFTSDAGQFTRYTENTAATFSIVAGQGQIANTSGAGRNDLITVTAGNFSQPCFFVTLDVASNPVQSAGADTISVGAAKDQNNFVVANYDRVSGALRLHIKKAGTTTITASTSVTLTPPYQLGLSLVGNSGCLWTRVGSGAWTFVAGADVNIASGGNDLRVTGALTDWKPAVRVSSSNNSTWRFDNLKWGAFGGIGMRDHAMVTQPDGAVFVEDTDVFFSATLPDPRGQAYAGIFRMDMLTFAYQQIGTLFVERGGKLQADLVPHIIRSGADSRLTIATWGNGFGGVLEVLHKNEVGVDLLSQGRHTVSSMTALSLPGHASGYGEYDAPLVFDASANLWLLGYSITQNTSFTGSPFYAALASSPDLVTWTQIGSPDTANMGYEGANIAKTEAGYYLMVGGPAGAADTSRVYDGQTFEFLGAFDAGFYGGADTQPHTTIFSYGDFYYILSFDNTRYGSASFTWGQPTLQRAYRTTELLLDNKSPADDEFNSGSSIDLTGDRLFGSNPWSWSNQGGATANLINGQLNLVAPASATRSYRAVEQVISGSAWKVRCKMKASFTQSNSANCGIFVKNNSTQRGVFLGYNFSGGAARFEGFRSQAPDIFSASVTGGTFTMLGGYFTQFKYFEIELAGGNLLLRTSVDGCRWTLRATEPVASWVVTPDRIGLFANSQNSNTVTGIFEWFRRVE